MDILMAMYDYYGGRQVVPQYYYYYYYYYYPSSSAVAPVTFLDRPRRSEMYPREDRYLDDNIYRRNYRLHENFDYSRHGLIPVDQVGRREAGGADVRPWWTLNRGYPGYGGMHHLPPQPWLYDSYETRGNYSSQLTVVEMYVPLCCDKCERKVRKHLKDIKGVESISADQWEKKVVVVGHNLHPLFLLRRVQRDKPASAFWSDRPQ